MNDPIQRCKVLTAGVLNLILVMGIARFAYTPLLPAMQEHTDLRRTEVGLQRLTISDTSWVRSLRL